MISDITNPSQEERKEEKREKAPNQPEQTRLDGRSEIHHRSSADAGILRAGSVGPP
jgi:hypothetical protein